MQLGLWLIAGVCMLGAAGALAMALWLPYAEAEARSTTIRPAVTGSDHRTLVATLPSAGDPIWMTPLRRSLTEEPAAEAPTAASTVPFASALAGTVIEPGRSMALFVAPDGRTQLKAEGEMVDNAKVIRITADRVTIECNGQRVEMALPKKERI